MFVLEGVCLARFRFYLMVWVVFNFGLLWLWYISRLLDSVATSGFGCFREISSGFANSNFAFMIVDLHLVSTWKSFFFPWRKGFLFRGSQFWSGVQ